MARLFPMLLAPVDDFFRIDDHADYPMTFTNELGLSGVVDQSLFEAAVEQAVDRNPLFKAIVGRGKRGQLCWIEAKDQQPLIDFAASDVPIECPCDGRIDLAKEVGLRLWVRQGTDTANLVLQYHHAVTDGNGAFRLIGDLMAAYHSLHSGDQLNYDPVEPQRLKTRAKRMGDVAITGTTRQLLKLGLQQARVLYGQKICPVSRPKQRDVSALPFPQTLTIAMSPTEYRELKAVAEASGVLINDLLTAQLFRTVVEWNHLQGGSLRGRIRVVIPSDLRGKEEFTMPAANMTSFAYASRKANQCGDQRALLLGIKREMLAIREERRATKFMDAVMLLQRFPSSMQLLKRWRKCISTVVLSNVGDPTRRFRVRLPRKEGKVRFGNLQLETWAGIAPLRPNTRAAVAVNTYNRHLAITAKCDPRWFGAANTRDFLQLFVGNLRSCLADKERFALQRA